MNIPTSSSSSRVVKSSTSRQSTSTSKPALSTLQQQLRLVLSEAPSRRAFVCHGHLPVVPTIMIESSNPLRPNELTRAPSIEHEPGVADARLYRILQPDAIQELSMYAHPAPYGKGPDTLFDTDVRSGLELTPDEICIGYETSEDAANAYRDWFKLMSTSRLSPMLESIRQQLAPRTPIIRARPYKVNLYAEGDHFIEHLDAPIAADHFATLLIFLPSTYTGGSLIVQHGGLEESFYFGDVELNEADLTRTSVGCHYVAFFTDCKHRVEPVTSGHRITLAYTLHIGEVDPWVAEHGMSSKSSSTTSKKQADKWIPLSERPTGAFMSHIYDQAPNMDDSSSNHSTQQPICFIGDAFDKKSNTPTSASSSTSRTTAPTPASDSSLPHAPPDEYLQVPGDVRAIRDLLNQPSTSTYCLPTAVVDIIVSYVGLSALHELFRHPDRKHSSVAYILAHGYPYVTIARAAAEYEEHQHERTQGLDGSVSISSSTTLQTMSSAAAGSDLSRSIDRLPPITTLHSPPAAFFLKGRDRDIADALIAACVGSDLRVRIIPIQVRIEGSLHRGEWDITKQPAEHQLLDRIDPNFERSSYDSSATSYLVNEIISFSPGGTIDQTRPLREPDTLFLNEWLNPLLSERPIESSHEADFQPDGGGFDNWHHNKLAWFYDGHSSEGTNVGNAGYNDQVELQYIAAAILIEPTTANE